MHYPTDMRHFVITLGLLATAACAPVEDDALELENGFGKSDGSAQATVTLSERKPHRQLQLSCSYAPDERCILSAVAGTPDDETIFKHTDPFDEPRQIAHVDLVQVPKGQTSEAFVVGSYTLRMWRDGALGGLIKSCWVAAGSEACEPSLEFDGGADSGLDTFRIEIVALEDWDWAALPAFDVTVLASWWSRAN